MIMLIIIIIIIIIFIVMNYLRFQALGRISYYQNSIL